MDPDATGTSFVGLLVATAVFDVSFPLPRSLPRDSPSPTGFTPCGRSSMARLPVRCSALPLGVWSLESHGSWRYHFGSKVSPKRSAATGRSSTRCESLGRR